MLKWRLLLGTIFIAAVTGLCWLDLNGSRPGAWLLPLALFIAVLASGELLWLFSARQLHPLAGAIYVGNLAIVLMASLPTLFGWSADWGPWGWPAVALAASVIFTLAGEMRCYTGPGAVSERLGLAVFSLCYVGLLMAFVVQIRFLGPNASWGLPALASLLIVVKMCDIGAYTVGRLIGRHKMAPVLSPGKTIEGAVGGIIFACVASWAVFYWLRTTGRMTEFESGSALGWLIFGLSVGIAGMVGDLAESLLKRDVGRKDSSPWMPGFGGVLDLLDSILVAAPVAYVCWSCRLVFM